MSKLLMIGMSIMLVGIQPGCMSSQMARVVSALGKDPATVHVRITSIYGSIEFARTNPGSNTLAHVVAPDGTVSVERSKAP